MIGALRYTTPNGLRVQVYEVGEQANLPIFAAEIVDADGEVVEHIPKIIGSTGLQFMAAKRRWVQQ